jgi:hypothetical protein
MLDTAFAKPDYWYGYAPYFLGRVAYERNLLETAADYFGQVEQMRYRVHTRLYHDSLIGLALVACARGEVDRAGTYASSARRAGGGSEVQSAFIFPILGLLRCQGVRLTSVTKLPEQLDVLRLWDGSEIPSGLRRRLLWEWAHRQFLSEQIAELEAERRALLQSS